MGEHRIDGAGLSPERWAYLKALHPGFGRYLHVSRHPLAVHGKTYDVGRNRAKREHRAWEASLGHRKDGK